MVDSGSAMESRSPRVFISYSHDSPEHADQILDFADRLRADGLDALIDQYEPWPAEGWPQWMDRQVREADFVLMVCTPTYYRRVMHDEHVGKGLGVQWESTLIYNDLYTAAGNDPRFIPILPTGGDTSYIPKPVQGKTHYRIDTTDGYEHLYRHLTNQPQARMPDLGKLRQLPPRERKQDFSDRSRMTQQPKSLSPNAISDRVPSPQGSRRLPQEEKAVNETSKDAIVNQVPTPDTKLDPILGAVLGQLEAQLERANKEMRESQQCSDLPHVIFYKAKEHAVQNVRRRGRVRAVNILDHHEWQIATFTRLYLIAERRAIVERLLDVERFFVGTVDQFESDAVRTLISRNEEDGVSVRRVYVNDASKRNPLFSRDIAFHETDPECMTEGLYDEGYLIHGRITTKDARDEAEQVFSHLERYSPQHLRTTEEQERLQRIKRAGQGWDGFYRSQRTPGGGEPSRILTEGNRLAQLIRQVHKDTGSDLERSSFSIVDVGCGDGTNSRYCVDICAAFRQEQEQEKEFFPVGFDIMGVDLSAVAVEMANANVRSALMSVPRVAAFHAVARDVTIDVASVTDTVDLLLCIDTFSHLHPADQKHALAEWRRVIRPGGRILLNVFCSDDDLVKECQDAEKEGAAIAERSHRLWWYRERVFKFYIEDEIRRIIMGGGFSIEDFRRLEWLEPAEDQDEAKARLRRHWVVTATKLN